MLWLTVATLGLNVALNVALAGRLGAVGPGIALVCTEFFNMMFNTWWLRRRCGYRSPVKFLLRLLVPTAASVVVTLLLSGQHVVLVLAAAAAAYLATSAAVGPVHLVDIGVVAPQSVTGMNDVNSPRVLWFSPWTRPAVRVQAEALLRHGADVLLVTSDRHPESDAARDYELVLDPRFRAAATWPPTLAAWRRIRKYRPDVVIAEQVRDPRWIALAGRTPRIQVVHDDRPHDPVEQRPAYEHAVLDRWGARSAATITYSDFVAKAVATRRDVAGTPVHVVPLASDLDLDLDSTVRRARGTPRLRHVRPAQPLQERRRGTRGMEATSCRRRLAR